MKDERITFRVTSNQKQELILNAKKEKMILSEYILFCIKEHQEVSGLNDGQGQFLNLFDTAYKRSSASLFNRLMVVLNKINFNVLVLVKMMNLFMKQLKVPQTKEEVITSFVDHPILTIAEEQALKEFRKAQEKRSDLNRES